VSLLTASFPGRPEMEVSRTCRNVSCPPLDPVPKTWSLKYDQGQAFWACWLSEPKSPAGDQPHSVCSVLRPLQAAAGTRFSLRSLQRRPRPRLKGALLPFPPFLIPLHACVPCSSPLLQPRLHESPFPHPPFGYVVMSPPPNVKLDPDKARKYMTIDGNRMNCGAPDFHFSGYKIITRLSVHLYTCSKAHAWKPEILSDIVATGRSGAAGRGPQDIKQEISQECHNFAISKFRSCMQFDQFVIPPLEKATRGHVGRAVFGAWASSASRRGAVGAVGGRRICSCGCHFRGPVHRGQLHRRVGGRDRKSRVQRNFLPRRALICGACSPRGRGGDRQEPTLPPAGGVGHPARRARLAV